MRALPERHGGELGHRPSDCGARGGPLSTSPGLDPGEVLTTAIGERDLAGARDVASVVDARIRRRVAGMVPLPQRPWSKRVPQVRPEHHAYVR